MKVIKSYFIGVSLLFIISVAFTACKKDCVCLVTRTTVTTSNNISCEMGKLTEDDCLSYNDSINDSEGVTRVITCNLN